MELKKENELKKIAVGIGKKYGKWYVLEDLPGSCVTVSGWSAPQNEVWGCMIRTPLVVNPSTA